MAQDATLKVLGYKQFLRASDRAGKDTKKETRETFRKVGDLVRIEGQRLFTQYNPRSAAGYRTRVRVRGVIVEQSLRKTTGDRPDYGALQMRVGLIPALENEADAVEREFELALDRVADHFDNL